MQIGDGSTLLLSGETLQRIIQDALNDCLFSHKLQVLVTEVVWDDEDQMFHIQLMSQPAPGK